MKEQMVLVEWEDITSQPGWFPKGLAMRDLIKPLRCYTLGFLVGKDSSNYYLSETYAKSPNEGDERYGAQTVIPKGCVLNVTRLKR